MRKARWRRAGGSRQQIHRRLAKSAVSIVHCQRTAHCHRHADWSDKQCDGSRCAPAPGCRANPALALRQRGLFLSLSNFVRITLWAALMVPPSEKKRHSNHCQSSAQAADEHGRVGFVRSKFHVEFDGRCRRAFSGRGKPSIGSENASAYHFTGSAGAPPTRESDDAFGLPSSPTPLSARSRSTARRISGSTSGLRALGA